MTSEMAEPAARERIFTRDFTLAFLANLASFLGFYLLLATLPTYVKGLVGAEWLAGAILGIFGLVGVVVRPLVGRLADLRGSKALMLVGAAVLVATMLLYPLAHTAPALFLLRVLQGVGWATFGTAASALVALIAPAARRGEAMGYYGVSGSAAMAVAPVIGVALVGGASGRYGTLFLVSAALALASALVTLPVRRRRPPSPSAARGLAALILPSAVFPSILAGVSTLTYAAVMFYIERYAEEQHLGNGGLFFTVLAVVLVLTRGPIGRLSDRVGRTAVIAGGLVCSGAAGMLLALPPTLSLLLTVAVLYGIGTAAVQPTLMALATDRAAPAERGAAMGTYTTAFDLGIGLGAALWGAVIGAGGFRIDPLLRKSVLPIPDHKPSRHHQDWQQLIPFYGLSFYKELHRRQCLPNLRRWHCWDKPQTE